MTGKKKKGEIINSFSWKIGGPAGFGIKASGEIMSKALMRAGLWVFDTDEYPSLIRGGHNTYQVRASDEEIHSAVRQLDILVALDEATITKNFREMRKGGIIIYEETTAPVSKIKTLIKKRGDIRLFPFPLVKIAEEEGNILMRNVVAIAASLAITAFPITVLNAVLRDFFRKKGSRVISSNIHAAMRGYKLAEKYAKEEITDYAVRLVPLVNDKNGKKKRILLTGNDATAMGAVQAGMKLYAAYPMTPASSILHTLAALERKYSLVVKHTEDELAAMNMAIGAGFAGVRAMVGTSGGGFALMTEALGMAGCSEVPVVAVVSQRVGPSTGMPTFTEQGDLRFVMHASQGDFPRVVLAPGDVEEAFYKIGEAFNYSEEYQLPVIVLLDKYLSESHKSVNPFRTSRVKIRRGKLLSQKELNALREYNRYEITPTGVSRRVIPGMKGGVHHVTSYEHDETGHFTEDSRERTAMVDKRMRKLEYLKKRLPEPMLYGNKRAKITIVTWGTPKGAILEAMKLLKKEGVLINLLHYIYILPFKEEPLMKISRRNRLIIAENNATGQFASVIREKTGIYIKDRILKYDGRPFFPEEIKEDVLRIIRGDSK